MPTITDIQHQKKRNSRYSIEVDGEYAFSLSDLELSNSGLRLGSELSTSEVEQWRAVGDEGKAYARALAYLARRQRSRHELELYLRRHDYHEDTVVAIIHRLEAIGMVNDASFAASWIRDRQALKPSSRRIIEQELRTKGITGVELEDALASINEEAETEALTAIIATKLRLPQYQDKDKLSAYLSRRGFGYDQIKQALNTFSNEL